MVRLFRKLRVLLKSSEIFSNWFLVGIKYHLLKHGHTGRNVYVRCHNGMEYSLPEHIYRLIVNAYYDGWITGVECGDMMYLVIK